MEDVLANTKKGEKMEKVERMGIETEKVSTALLDKNFSPLIVRKYSWANWPLFVSLICDISLSDLDSVVNKCYDDLKEKGMISNDIQAVRNCCGYLSEKITEHYDNIKRGCVEGVAVIWYVDKLFCSSLTNDYMVHLSCKLELFSIINTMPHI